MWASVVCFTCGCPTGEVAPFFTRMREELIKKELAASGVVATHAADEVRARVDCSAIFEQLGVQNDCCRMRLATHMDFFALY